MMYGFTLPLTLAAYQGNCDSIKAPLQHGADINKRQPRIFGPITALSSAHYGRQTAAAGLLIGRGADYDIEIDSISEIVLSRDIESLKEYVRHGVSRICAQAALRVASGKSYNDAVRFLLKSGANANGFEDSDVAEILKRIRTIEDDGEEDDKDVEDTPFLPRYSLRAKLLNKNACPL